MIILERIIQFGNCFHIEIVSAQIETSTIVVAFDSSTDNSDSLDCELIVGEIELFEAA